MKKEKIISGLLAIVGVVMISIAMMLQDDFSVSVEEVDIRSMAASTNMYVKNSSNNDSSYKFESVDMEVAPASVEILPKVEVYDGLTLEELAAKLDRNLGDGYIAGKGELIASYCIERGVDPYVAVAIMLHETGCRANCSNLVKVCNNVGGQKGSPGCGNGSFKKFDTLEEGIYGFINNLDRNYYSKGLNTVELIAPKYCEGNTWAGKINWYVDLIKNS